MFLLLLVCCRACGGGGPVSGSIYSGYSDLTGSRCFGKLSKVVQFLLEAGKNYPDGHNSLPYYSRTHQSRMFKIKLISRLFSRNFCQELSNFAKAYPA